MIPQGVNFELLEIRSEGRMIRGGFFSPDKKVFRKPNTGVVLIHGVQGTWDQGVPMFLSCYLAERGYACLGINGAHSGLSYQTSELETAMKDAGAAVRFMNERGFKNIFLVGHSLGTIIIEFYQGSTQDPTIKAMGLYSPHINMPVLARDILLGPGKYANYRKECLELVAKGKGDELRLLSWREGVVIVTSAKTFLSYRDIDKSNAMAEKWVRQIRVPIFIVYDPMDDVHGEAGAIKRETLVAQIKENAIASPKVDILIVPPITGTPPIEAHSFVNNEKFVTQATVDWLKSVELPPASGLIRKGQ